MKRTLISLCIAAAYGGTAVPPVMFGLPGRVIFRGAANPQDEIFDWSHYLEGDKP